MTSTEYPWLLPSAIADPLTQELPGDRGRERPRRTVRDWIVDTIAFLFSVGVWMLVVDAAEQGGTHTVMAVADQLVGAAACCAVWLRRRWPVQLAVALSVASMLVPLAGGAFLFSLFSLAVHRPFRPVAAVAALAVVSSVAQPFVRPETGAAVLAEIVGGIVLLLLVLGWGMLVRSRRQLVVALRERARRAEAEAELRAQQAQRLAREAIAREMHDVLAHRLTLLSVHAGALEFRPDAPTVEIARAAGVIRDSAHEALQDLREIIGVLRRSDDDREDADRPQPTLATLGALVDESRLAGMDVALDNSIEESTAVPASTGRTVYRIAQEGLTNARKHAPGAEVTVTVTGGPGEGVTVAVWNPAPAGPGGGVPGSGQGLIGLTERAMLAGGRLEHGPTGDGGFAVRSWLPWPA
ncbi:sensor histidine kinase [Streptomyces sp. NPDC059176]|uniref:sensor histidine kinase n=1 Tax=unclassified Streptomyces TaxID=2593676 RepID=UPI00367C4A15